MREKNNPATFWEHLDALRWTIIRIVIVLFVIVAVLFGFKDFVFDQVVFLPLRSDFVIYRFFCYLADVFQSPSLCPADFHIELININLSGQFVAHITATFTIAIVLAIPYILYEIWLFVAPALYPAEKSNIGWVFFSASFLFYLGALVSYYLIFPLSIRFLGTYEISDLVPNQISVQSYLSTLYVLVFALGLMFEMPVLALVLSKIGIINKSLLRKGRKYAFVIILILAAVITPTTDPFTMMVVALPLYLLYEVSIMLCRKAKPAES
ncbi:MAG: twin-arginine translocase subunit TatC [Paludibacter sp.]|jgi:sec-independent protein translocase protein TatC|nr:twin-arginine translocase subunit TatC [Paludibacter sp.]